MGIGRLWSPLGDVAYDTIATTYDAPPLHASGITPGRPSLAARGVRPGPPLGRSRARIGIPISWREGWPMRMTMRMATR